MNNNTGETKPYENAQYNNNNNSQLVVITVIE